MTKQEAIEILGMLKKQFEDCVRIANSPCATDWQKESLSDNLENVKALEMGIKALEKVGILN